MKDRVRKAAALAPSRRKRGLGTERAHLENVPSERRLSKLGSFRAVREDPPYAKKIYVCTKYYMACYREEVFWFSNPLFSEDLVPVSYLLTMENSPRRDSYLEQLNEYRPTRKVVVLHNKGWKHCKKPAWVTNSAYDLWHANLEVTNRTTGRVLVLEDDVQFLPNIRQDVAEVEEFLRHMKDTKDTKDKTFFYTLGLRLFYTTTRKSDVENHLRVIIGADAHAILYNNIKALTPPTNPNPFHDVHVFSSLHGYTYKRPLAIQHAEATENSIAYDPFRIVSYLNNIVGDENLFSLVHSASPYGGLFVISLVVLLTLYFVTMKLNAQGLSHVILLIVIIFSLVFYQSDHRISIL